MKKQEFINKVVFGWMKGDLERMVTKIRPDRDEMGNINFPLALCTLSYMEYLGGFLLEKDTDYLSNVTVYISECFSNPTEYPARILRDLMRNGLAHNYFPYGAISRNEFHPAFYKGRNFDIVLDAESLVKDFLNSLETFREKLEDEKYESRMRETLAKISEFKEKHKDFIDALRPNPDDDEYATPSHAAPDDGTEDYTTRTSGASGIAGPMNTTTDPSLM